MELLRRLRNRRKDIMESSSHRQLYYRKVVLSGNFFPLDRENFISRLEQFRGEIQLELDSETEVLICGKYPDWDLIAAAKERLIQIIFLDKVSDLFAVTHRESYKLKN